MVEHYDEVVRSEIDPEQYNNDENEEVTFGEEQDGGTGEEDDAVEDREDGEEEEAWKEWIEGDKAFTEFKWSNSSGFKPPHGQIPTSPIQYFELFFTDELLSEIVTETNRYAQEKIMKHTPLRKKSMWWSWKDVTLEEMKAFLGGSHKYGYEF